MMNIDAFLYEQQRSSSKVHPNAFTVAYSNEDIVRYRNNIVRFCTATAIEISGRLQGKIIRSNKPAFLTRTQRQKLLQYLQNISSLAVYDGLQENKNIDALNAFTSLQALLNVNGTSMGGIDYNSSSKTKMVVPNNEIVMVNNEEE